MPQVIIAAGVFLSFPALMSLFIFLDRFLTPIRNTTVPISESAFQGTEVSSFPGFSWPVTTANEDVWSLCVRGMPAYAGTEDAEVTPGTISNTIFSLCRASASSPPRPKTNGSPPFSLATVFPSEDFLTKREFISFWVASFCPALFPT